GLARALVLHPDLPENWRAGRMPEPHFPKFAKPPEGGITAWYTMRLADLGEDREPRETMDLDAVLQTYNARDEARIPLWKVRFGI
ncbi:MAG: oxidoreductase, partial [Pseudomonadota bacterium]